MRLMGFHLQRAFLRGRMHQLNVQNKKEYRLLRAFSTYPITNDFKTNLRTKAVIPELPVALRGMFSKSQYSNTITTASSVMPLYTFRRQVNKYFDLTLPSDSARNQPYTQNPNKRLNLVTNLIEAARGGLSRNQTCYRPNLHSTSVRRTLFHSHLKIRSSFKWTKPRHRKRRRVWRRDLRSVLKSQLKTAKGLTKSFTRLAKYILRHQGTSYSRAVPIKPNFIS